MATTQKFATFEDLIASSDRPVLVDFYAAWCGPCQLMAKVLDEINGELKSKLKIVKINTEKYPELASRHQIHALPTLVLFRDGQAVDRIEGLMPTPQLLAYLQTFVNQEG